MNGNPVVPFEKNRYYSGKRLTSADFEAEQQYVNRKREFINNIMFGSGIVYGCNVNSVDNQNICVQTGAALDGHGREIIINRSNVKKLSAIAGFEETESRQVTLCVRYKEENVQQVCSVSKTSSEAEYEYNRIQEGYELFLMDSDKVERVPEVENAFLSRNVIYQDENYEIYLVVPATVCRNKYVGIQVGVKKISNTEVPFSFEGCIQMPSFFNKKGKHELDISISDLCLEEGENEVWKHSVFVQDTTAAQTSLILKKGVVCLPDEEKEITSDVVVKVKISDEKPRDLVNREIGSVNLDGMRKYQRMDSVCLADIFILRTENGCVIEKIEESKVKKYIETLAQKRIRDEYLEFFRAEQFGTGMALAQESPRDSQIMKCSLPETKMRMASGVIEIPIGGKAKAGEVFYSGEVMHGLGSGEVYVEIGQEFIEEDRVKGANSRSTVFGNSKLFSEYPSVIPKTEKAVKVLNDKGSFIAAISFTEDTDCLILSYRWVAMKIANNKDVEMEENTERQWIEAKTPTVVLGTRESCYFDVKFHEMEKCSIQYQVTEEDGGQISMDGIYTAPNKEGVYEIMISCIEYPHICTYAYAIVKKK